MLSAQSRAVLACGIGRVRALPARRVSWLWRARTSISGGLSAPQPPHIRPFALRAQIGGVPGSRTWQRPAALDWDAPSPACHHERPREHGSGPSQWFIDPIGHFSTPEGKGGKHPGRPPGGRSTWCVLYIVSCKRFLSLSFALRPAKYELYTGRMYLSPFLPRARRANSWAAPFLFCPIRRVSRGYVRSSVSGQRERSRHGLYSLADAF